MTDSRKWFILAAVASGGWLLYLLAPVLTPFLMAALFAYLGDPAADRLEDRGLSRIWAVVVVFLLMTLAVAILVLLLVPLVQKQIILLAHTLPQYLEWLSVEGLPWLEQTFGFSAEQINREEVSRWFAKYWSEAGNIVAGVMAYLTKSGAMLAAWLANLVLIPVVTFYLLRDWDEFVAGISHLLPRDLEPEITHIAREADAMLGAFLRGQVTVMLCLGTIYSVGLWLAGLKLALLVGMLAGLVSFVPYLGFIVGILVAGVAILLQTHEPLQLLPVGAVFVVGQMMEGMLLTPLLVGDRIGLHPVAVIFAVLAGGQLFGFGGILLALPTAAVLAVIVRDLHRRYLDSRIYQTSQPGEPDDVVP